jgi:hypothetical protein
MIPQHYKPNWRKVLILGLFTMIFFASQQTIAGDPHWRIKRKTVTGQHDYFMPSYGGSITKPWSARPTKPAYFKRHYWYRPHKDSIKSKRKYTRSARVTRKAMRATRCK